MRRNQEYEDLTYYFKDIKNIRVLTHKEEISLARRIRQNDQDAFNELIKHNLRLVVAIAKDFTGNGISFKDLITEGNFGLIKAIKRYDYRKGARFSTYSAWWIKNAIRRAISNKSKIIRLPALKTEALHKYDMESEFLISKIGRIPTPQEISKEIGIPYEKLTKPLILRDVNSLDAIIEREAVPFSFYDVIEDKRENIEGNIIYESLREKFSETLNSILSKMEVDIIEKRFGFNGYKIYTLRELGKEYGRSPEGMRQMENRILRKLRGKKEVRELACYLENEPARI